MTNKKVSNKKILVTGGTGLLGSELLKFNSSLIAPTHKEMDIESMSSVENFLTVNKPSIVVHLAAATKPPEHEKSPELGLRTNIIGTANLALICSRLDIRLVYTSTDYVYVGSGPHTEDEPILPPYKFAWSKLGGEAAVALISDYLILRLSFGPNPFPWKQVYKGQYNSKLYVDEVAPLILSLAQTTETGIMNVGGPRTSLEEYAKRTRPDIDTIPRPDFVPKDTSLDVTYMCKTLNIDDINTYLIHNKK